MPAVVPTRALPTPERLLALVDRLAGQPVILLVDLVADRFITGSPKRISREAPVLILRHEHEEVLPGGGANAAANVAALGGVPLPVGIVGADSSGDELLAAFAARGIATGGILRRDGYRTPTKVRILAGARHSIKQQVVRYDVEGELALAADDRAFLAEQLRRLRGEARVAVLSDYGYGAVDPSLVAPARAAVGDAGTVLCDSRYRLADFVGVDGATPNEEEAEATLGRGLGEGDALRDAGATLRERLRARFVLVTRGSLGMALFEDGGSSHLPVHGTDQVADVTGAGDTVIGTFALALAAGGTPLEAALLANYAGGVVVMKRGTATLSREELRAAIERDRGLPAAVRQETG
ncbi:MAG TPA: PfkB family carbohydrate kinase [Thermoanaerobaculia bacterium]|jgi:rfaE bifunctional protein kinase chain/domain|nr:PfkB family carbohydrate kinase [Thermoanaerobaculia bacterium]